MTPRCISLRYDSDFTSHPRGIVLRYTYEVQYETEVQL